MQCTSQPAPVRVPAVPYGRIFEAIQQNFGSAGTNKTPGKKLMGFVSSLASMGGGGGGGHAGGGGGFGGMMGNMLGGGGGGGGFGGGGQVPNCCTCPACHLCCLPPSVSI